MSWSWSYLKTLLGIKKVYSNDDYIAVMWPVVYPSTYPAPKDPHVTIIMLGTTDTANFTKEEVLEAIGETDWNEYLLAYVTSLKWFGENKDIPVLGLSHTFLHPYKQHLERRLAERGIFNTSSFPDYQPHCTITVEAANEQHYPMNLLLAPVQLWWGTERIDVV